MPQLQQTVTFSHEDITKLLLEKAKEQIKAETGKEPTGSSTTSLGSENNIDVQCVVAFHCNGKR